MFDIKENMSEVKLLQSIIGEGIRITSTVISKGPVFCPE